VQLDHIHPFSCGGTHTVDNLRVTCGPHNRYVFERDWVGILGIRKVAYAMQPRSRKPLRDVG
jgi:hypothetical protein